jgi:membrane protease YdiL (CAAX protease family)
MDISPAIPRPYPAWLSIFTWASVLLVSDLPNAIWQALVGEPPDWLIWVKAILLLVLILAGLAWEPLRPARTFFLLLLLLLMALWGMNWLRGTTAYREWEEQAGWMTAMAGFQALKLVVVLILVAVLMLLGRRWKDFFFTRGELSAPVSPTRGKKGRRPLTWGSLGLILGLCIAPLTLLFFGLGNLPSAATLAKALPYFPAALLFAATNAFAEEAQFRASLLGEVRIFMGDEQAIWLTAVFFGFAHYFGGAPSGIPGVLIAGLLGALFAKTMLGSKGIVVPWFVHFCQNAVIYAFWAIGAVV